MNLNAFQTLGITRSQDMCQYIEVDAFLTIVINYQRSIFSDRPMPLMTELADWTIPHKTPHTIEFLGCEYSRALQ